MLAHPACVQVQAAADPGRAAGARAAAHPGGRHLLRRRRHRLPLAPLPRGAHARTRYAPTTPKQRLTRSNVLQAGTRNDEIHDALAWCNAGKKHDGVGFLDFVRSKSMQFPTPKVRGPRPPLFAESRRLYSVGSLRLPVAQRGIDRCWGCCCAFACLAAATAKGTTRPTLRSPVSPTTLTRACSRVQPKFLADQSERVPPRHAV